MIDPNTAIAELVLDHPECAAVLQRHRLDYCCRGETPLRAACQQRGLDVATVVEALETEIHDRRPDEVDARALSVGALVEHILSRYHAPLRKVLPFVRSLGAKVARVHGEHNPRLVELDRLVTELATALEEHIDDEEKTLFPAVTGRAVDAQAILRFSDTTRDEHEAVGRLLTRMRAAAEDYAVPDWGCNSYRVLYRELEGLETEVLRHVHLENHVLLPRFANGAGCASPTI